MLYYGEKELAASEILFFNTHGWLELEILEASQRALTISRSISLTRSDPNAEVKQVQFFWKGIFKHKKGVINTPYKDLKLRT